ncbi:MAG: AarF/UbiB family protein [Spirochaetales bacterium]
MARAAKQTFPSSEKRHVILRTGEILGLVVSHGFGYLLAKPERRRGEAKLRGKKGTSGVLALPPSRWVRIRLLLEALGPTFIKMGQMFSNRPDLLPEELLIELRKLQDGVPGFAFAQVKQMLESDYGQALDAMFLRFEEVPLASASIAQVHTAVLSSGQRVAVKVLRPGIESQVATDLEILSRIGLWFEKIILRSDVIDTQGILREFTRTMEREMDFQNEALYLEKFAANFRGDPDVLVPKVYRSHSAKRVLVMDFIDGLHPLDWDGYRQHGLDRRNIARKGAQALLKQVFVHGFFHADPHTGNLLILPDGRICFLDFGMMGIIFERYRIALAHMLLAVAQTDAPALTAALLSLSTNPDPGDSTALEEDVFVLLETFSHVPLAKLDLTAFLEKTVTIILQHRLSMPPSLYLLLKALLTIEGFGRQLDPDFDLVSEVEPFVREVFAKKLDLGKAGGRSAESALDYLSLAADLPGELRQALTQLKRGRLKLEIDKETLDPILHKADKISNRLAFALIVTGGVMASATALQSKIPPLWNDIPIIAIIGFTGSFVLGFALAISIWRSGRF